MTEPVKKLSLLDIAPLPASKVAIRGGEMEITALTLQQIGAIIYEFPEIQKLASAAEDDRLGVLATGLIKFVPMAVNRIIAECIVTPGDVSLEARELAASNMRPDEQLKIIIECVRTSFPDGIDPFVETFNDLWSKLPDNVRNGLTTPDASTGQSAAA